MLVVAGAAMMASTLMASPANARGWHHGGFGWGPGIGFGLVAGALAAGAYGAYGPYGYGYDYGPAYYGYAPAYYGYAPAYYDAPYAYYPRHRYYRRHYYYRGW